MRDSFAVLSHSLGASFLFIQLHHFARQQRSNRKGAYKAGSSGRDGRRANDGWFGAPAKTGSCSFQVI